MLVICPLGLPKYMPLISSLTTTRSTFSTISFFKVLESISDFLIFTGRMFAKRFNADLNLSKPLSGLNSLGRESYFISPTHANRTASLLLH